MIFPTFVVGSLISATALALTYNPDLLTRTIYDSENGGYTLTTRTRLGFSLFYALPSVLSDNNENFKTLKDFSAYTDYIVSFNSKYRTQLNSLWSANGYTSYDVLEAASSLVSQYALTSNKFTFDATETAPATDFGSGSGIDVGTYSELDFGSYSYSALDFGSYSYSALDFGSYSYSPLDFGSLTAFNYKSLTASMLQSMGTEITEYGFTLNSDGSIEALDTAKATRGGAKTGTDASQSAGETAPSTGSPGSDGGASSLACPYLVLAFVFGGISLLMF